MSAEFRALRVFKTDDGQETRLVALSDADLESIGRRVWKNECGETREGLTSWNEGEAFASLGIGHFIWYPAGRPGPFEESFPPLVQYLGEHGQTVPGWSLKARLSSRRRSASLICRISWRRSIRRGTVSISARR